MSIREALHTIAPVICGWVVGGLWVVARRLPAWGLASAGGFFIKAPVMFGPKEFESEDDTKA